MSSIHKKINNASMPKRKQLEEYQHQRWSTRVRRQTTVYTPPGRNVPQLQPSKRSCHPSLTGNRVPSHEEIFSRPETKVRVGKNFCQSPIIVGVITKKKECTPEPVQKERHDVTRFLYHSFGNGFENEQKHSNNPFYAYWNKYGRSDVQPCTSLEKNCFLCHGFVGIRGCAEETENGGCHSGEDLGFAICSVYNCPKVYHRSCLLDSNLQEGHFDSEHWVCPRHYCNTCKSVNLFNSEFCPTCPYSTCQQCLNNGFSLRVSESPKANECPCRNCRMTARCLDAPEILMNLRTIC